VVTGAIIDADKQWKRLEEYYRILAHDIFPHEELFNFVFHAKDIWHGSGPFDRKRFSRRDRLTILKRLAQVPALFQIPIACAAIDRVAFTQQESYIERSRNSRHPQQAARLLVHAYAFVRTVHAIDYWMQHHAASNEVAMLIAEDTAQVRSVFEMFHLAYTYKGDDIDELIVRAKSIVDNVHFAKKQTSILLQMADHCAFILRRRLSGHADVAELYNLIRPQLREECGPEKRYDMVVPISHLAPVEDS